MQFFDEKQNALEAIWWSLCDVKNEKKYRKITSYTCRRRCSYDRADLHMLRCIAVVIDLVNYTGGKSYLVTV